MVLQRAYELAHSGEAKATVPWLGAKLALVHAHANRVDLALLVIDESRWEAGPAHAFTELEFGRALHALRRRDEALDALTAAENTGRIQNERAVLAWCAWLRGAIAAGDGNWSVAEDALARAYDEAAKLGLGILMEHCKSTRDRIAPKA